ncbi:MAG: aspartate--tRNA ligase, partial [Candidatus Geothermincolia bacterium]
MNGTSWEPRTHYCGALRAGDAGSQVVLDGWVQRRRDHGGLIFIDLRDRDGMVQVVFNPQHNPEAHALAEDIRPEYVLSMRGTVGRRPPESINPHVLTGEVEVTAEAVSIVSTSKTPPFEVKDDVKVDEALRLRYRFLDLRRPEMTAAIVLRAAVTRRLRAFLEEKSFLEIETPMLTKSTPEGARDFIVPSRVQAGHFFALPQSPQLFKQILMVAGFDRYYQVVRCFRDEDLRADRQPEFTQVDLELSFVRSEDLMALMDEMFADLMTAIAGYELELPLQRFTYAEAMNLFGSDRPDLRYRMTFKDMSDAFKESEFGVFRQAVAEGGVVRGFKLQGVTAPTRRQLDDLSAKAKELGAAGLVWMVAEDGGTLRSPIAKFMSRAEMSAVVEALRLWPGEVALFVAGERKDCNEVLGGLRGHCIETYQPEPEQEFAFAWVTDFPLFDWDEEGQRLKANHHPFTSPTPASMEFLDERPLDALSDSYDLVMNGIEIGGGSIRIHDGELQQRIFNLMGMAPEESKEKFGFLLEAFEYGPPPHGGIAFGLDRLVMLMAGRKS